MQTTGTSDNPYQYTGRENDGSGLYYYRARYYSPTVKRFISEDPIGLAAGMNGYGYVGGNPLSYRDPFGLSPLGDITAAYCPGGSCIPPGFGQPGWQPPPPPSPPSGPRLPDYAHFQFDAYAFLASATYTKYGDVTNPLSKK